MSTISICDHSKKKLREDTSQNLLRFLKKKKKLERKRNHQGGCYRRVLSKKKPGRPGVSVAKGQEAFRSSVL